MAGQPTRTQPGPVRALVVVALLAGVFAMHGLTGNHDAAMAMTGHLPSVAMPAEPAPDQPLAVAAVHSTGMTQATGAAVVVPAAGVPGSAVIVEPSDQGHSHSMGDVCLAMLAALLLALIVALARRSLVVAHPVVLTPTRVAVVTDGPSPLWQQPTLSKLCILRT